MQLQLPEKNNQKSTRVSLLKQRNKSKRKEDKQLTPKCD